MNVADRLKLVALIQTVAQRLRSRSKDDVLAISEPLLCIDHQPNILETTFRMVEQDNYDDVPIFNLLVLCHQSELFMFSFPIIAGFDLPEPVEWLRKAVASR